MARWKKTYDLVQQVQQLGQQIEATASEALSQAIVINDDVDDIESQITSGKAESIRDDQEFIRLMQELGLELQKKESTVRTIAEKAKAVYAHIEAVREKDREEAAEPYSDMLRELCFQLSVGGYNSEGLMPVETARAKINDGLTMLVEPWRGRAIKAEAERDHWKAEAETWKGAAAHDFGDDPRHIVARQAAGLSDEAIVQAVHKAHAMGRVSLTWVDKDGKEMPTDIARCFVKATLSPAQQEPAKNKLDAYLKASQELDAATDNLYKQEIEKLTSNENWNPPFNEMLRQYKLAYDRAKNKEAMSMLVVGLQNARERAASATDDRSHDADA